MTQFFEQNPQTAPAQTSQAQANPPKTPIPAPQLTPSRRAATSQGDVVVPIPREYLPTPTPPGISWATAFETQAKDKMVLVTDRPRVTVNGRLETPEDAVTRQVLNVRQEGGRLKGDAIVSPATVGAQKYPAIQTTVLLELGSATMYQTQLTVPINNSVINIMAGRRMPGMRPGQEDPSPADRQLMRQFDDEVRAMFSKIEITPRR